MEPTEEDPFDLIADDINDEGEDTGREALKYAFYNFTDTKKISSYVKAQFDESHGQGWNVIIGKDFGSHVVHKTNNYMFGKIKQFYVLIWRA